MASLYTSPPREQRRSQIPVISVGVSPDFLGRRGGRARPTGAPPRNTSTSQNGNPTSPAQRYAAQSAAAAAEEAGPAVDVDDGDTSSLYELSSISGDEEEAGYGRRHLSPTSHRPSGTAARVTHSAANHAPNRGGGYSTAFRADPDSGSAPETWESTGSGTEQTSPRRPGTLAKYVQRFRHAPALSPEARERMSTRARQRSHETAKPEFWWLHSEGAPPQNSGAGHAVGRPLMEADHSPRRLVPAPSGSSSPVHPACMQESSPTSLAVSDYSSDASSSRRGAAGSSAPPYLSSTVTESDAASIIAAKLQDSSLATPSLSSLEKRIELLIAESERFRQSARASNAVHLSPTRIGAPENDVVGREAHGSAMSTRANVWPSTERDSHLHGDQESDVLLRYRRDRIRSEVASAVSGPVVSQSAQSTQQPMAGTDSDSVVETDAETRLGDRLRMWAKGPPIPPRASTATVVTQTCNPEHAVRKNTVDAATNMSPPTSTLSSRQHQASQTDLPQVVHQTPNIVRATRDAATDCHPPSEPTQFRAQPSNGVIPVRNTRGVPTAPSAAQLDAASNPQTYFEGEESPLEGTRVPASKPPDGDAQRPSSVETTPIRDSWEQDGVLLALKRRARALKLELSRVEFELEGKQWT